MDKIVIQKDHRWVFRWASIFVILVLLITGYSWFSKIRNSETQLILIFRILNVISITAVSFINVCIYYPSRSSQYPGIDDKIVFKINATKSMVIAMAIVLYAIALIKLDNFFIFSLLVISIFFCFYFYDLMVLFLIRKEISDAGNKLKIIMKASLTGYTRPMFRTYSIVFLIITIFFLLSKKTNYINTISTLETFLAGMVTFSLISTTLIFIEQNTAK